MLKFVRRQGKFLFFWKNEFEHYLVSWGEICLELTSPTDICFLYCAFCFFKLTNSSPNFLQKMNLNNLTIYMYRFLSQKSYLRTKYHFAWKIITHTKNTWKQNYHIKKILPQKKRNYPFKKNISQMMKKTN